jgi:hypothetical protein
MIGARKPGRAGRTPQSGVRPDQDPGFATMDLTRPRREADMAVELLYGGS